MDWKWETGKRKLIKRGMGVGSVMATHKEKEW